MVYMALKCNNQLLVFKEYLVLFNFRIVRSAIVEATQTEENSILTCPGPGETFSEVDLYCVTTTKKKKVSSTVTDFISSLLMNLR